ncbi:hypothetical protein Tco_0660027 [Tanacetum coccineum]
MEAVKKHVGIPIDEAAKGVGGMAHFVSKFDELADPEYASHVVKGETHAEQQEAIADNGVKKSKNKVETVS